MNKETIFKLGQKAYDQINFPDKEGSVVRILDDKDNKFYIGVFFKGENFPFFYSNEGCLSGRKIPTLSTNPYKVILEGFEQKPYIPTFEDIVKERNYVYLSENLVAPNKELCDAVKALLELLFLRDYYNDGWQPDWKDESLKYIIRNVLDYLSTNHSKYGSYVMAFKSKEIMNKFLEDQKELLEIAKPLL